MAYHLSYWKTAPTPDTHYELRRVRLKSIEEVTSLALPHNRPKGTSLILLEMPRSYKSKHWIDERTVWEEGMSDVTNVIKLPHRTKRTA